MCKKITLVLAVSTLIILTACNTEKKKVKSIEIKKPNIVLILSDDQAWNDYGFMGHDIIETPNLDKLASQSVVFKRGYVPTPVCRPSLMTLSTGLYPHQHKITGNDPKGGYSNPEFPREELLKNIDSIPTLQGVLSANGYLTHQSGKWWEGDYKRGGFTHGMTEGQRHGDKGLDIGRKGMDSIFNFINQARSKDKPFYVWYAPFLPHTPHNPPDSLFQKYVDKVESKHLARYYAMIEWFDSTCGELIDYLDENNLRENTLIYYVCDNGWIQNPDKPKFDKRSKQTPMEGGIRTPILFSMAGTLKPSLRNDLISSIDILPTILKAVNIEIPETLPGLNLWENLKNEIKIDRNIVFGEAYGHDVIDIDKPEASLGYLWCIEDDWKLILSYDGTLEGGNGIYDFTHDDVRSEPIRLYNITNDPFENKNLSSKHPDKVQELRKKIEEWHPLKDRKLITKNRK